MVKYAMLAHLELLTIKAISYSRVSVRAIYRQIGRAASLWLARCQVYTGSGNDLFPSLRNETCRQNSVSASGNNHQAVPPTVPKACRTWNYTVACEFDQQDTAAYKEHHRCRVCKGDHPMLHHRRPRRCWGFTGLLSIKEKWKSLNRQNGFRTTLERHSCHKDFKLTQAQTKVSFFYLNPLL